LIPFPDINPNLIEIGPIKVRWYGLMYALGFLGSYILVSLQDRARRIGLRGSMLQDLMLYLVIGLILGARFGYILFYQFGSYAEYLRHPLEIIAVWHGGMSFHGGLIGALSAGLIFCRKKRIPIWLAADALIVTAPVGLGLGRIGNFINGELFGRPSSVPWAMVFPLGGPQPRHPSQLYEAMLEGLLLFVILWRLKNRPFRPGTMVCLFLAGYGLMRFFVEFFREPDPQLGLLWNVISMGQVLSLVMILGSLILWMLRPKSRPDFDSP